MSLKTVLPELSKLTRKEKAEVIRILQEQMAQHKDTQASTYEVWSPQITPEAARELLKMPREDNSIWVIMPTKK